MRLGFRFAISFYIGFLVYTSLVLVFGASGYFAMKDLTAYRDRLAQNIVELKDNHGELARQRDALLVDFEEIQLRARELGYLTSGETIVELPGPDKNVRRHTLGRVILRPDLSQTGHTVYRAISSGAALLGFILLSIIHTKKNGFKTGR